VRHARRELWFEVPQRRAYLNITPEVEVFVRESGIIEGLRLVNPMHITAAVYVNDDEQGLIADIDDWLERLAPHEPVAQDRHNNGEDNADAHLKRQLMAPRSCSRSPTAGSTSAPGSRSSTPSSTAPDAGACCSRRSASSR